MRDLSALQSDPEFPFRVGQMVGAAEMMSVYMSLHGSPEARGMAERVHALLSFFLTEEERAPLPPPAPTKDPHLEDTMIIPPAEVEAERQRLAQAQQA